MNYRRAIVIGSTGMLGRSFVNVLKDKNIDVICLSRNNSDYNINLLNENHLYNVISKIKADLVINCAAIVSIDFCESNPILARKVNAEAIKILTRACCKNHAKFIQISTDHYYENDTRKLHNELDKLIIVNQYAKSKRLGEIYSREYENSLIIRTNVTGIRGDKENLTFFEWLYNSFINQSPISLFTDFYTSTIDTETLAKYVINLVLQDCTGFFNIASAECLSKKEFALIIAKKMCIDISWVNDSSVAKLKPRRANSLGLDCTKAESLIGIKMPSADAVATNLLKFIEN